jgi:hypothetical protein
MVYFVSLRLRLGAGRLQSSLSGSQRFFHVAIWLISRPLKWNDIGVDTPREKKVHETEGEIALFDPRHILLDSRVPVGDHTRWPEFYW